MTTHKIINQSANIASFPYNLAAWQVHAKVPLQSTAISSFLRLFKDPLGANQWAYNNENKIAGDLSSFS